MAEGNCIFFYNPVDISTLTITATTEDSANGFGKDKLENPDLDVTFRTTDILQTDVVFDAGVGNTTSIQGVVILNHNIISDTPDTTFQYRGGAADPPATDIKDITMPASTDRPNSFYHFAMNYRYIGIRGDKAAGSYWEMGYVFMFQNILAIADADGAGDIGNRGLAYEIIPVPIETEIVNQKTGFIERECTKIAYHIPLVFNGITQYEFDQLIQVMKGNYCVILPDGLEGDFYYGVFKMGNFRRIFAKGKWFYFGEGLFRECRENE